MVHIYWFYFSAMGPIKKSYTIKKNEQNEKGKGKGKKTKGASPGEAAKSAKLVNAKKLGKKKRKKKAKNGNKNSWF